MREFIKATFPFVDDPPGSVNLICRDSEREPNDRSCPFVCLSAYSFANAMLLALFSECTEKIDTLDSNYARIEETLQKNVNRQPVDIPEGVKKATFQAATDLGKCTQILEIQHPVVDIFVSSIKNNSCGIQSVDDIKKAIREIVLLFQDLRCGYDRTNAANAEKNLQKLRTNCRPFILALSSLKKVRESTSECVWKSRTGHFEIALVPKDGWQQDRRLLETALLKRVVPTMHDSAWVLCKVVDVSQYSDMLA